MTNEMTTRDASEEFPSLALVGDNDVEVQSVLGRGHTIAESCTERSRSANIMVTTRQS